MYQGSCPVCTWNDFRYQPVLWDELIAEWQLSPEEAIYINRQQGLSCSNCGCNLRSMALAGAINSFLGWGGSFREYANSEKAAGLAILEINEAGTLTPILKQFPRHQLIQFPDANIHDLNLPSESFDLVVHSDTLEHVEHPVRGLAECLRVLKPGGACCFTIPVVVGRLTRNRTGLPPSYHGNPNDASDDLKVRTEFGADFWSYAFEAGFSRLEINALEYPSGLAITLWR